MELAVGGDHEAASGRALDDLDRPAYQLVIAADADIGGESSLSI